MSADIQTSSHELAEQAGAKAFVNKPFDKAEILAALDDRAGRSCASGPDRCATRRARSKLINIGFGRAAASLSKLTGHRVQLEVPQVTMCPIEEMARPSAADARRATWPRVHQIFSGPVEGDALLVIDQHSAAILKELLTSEPALPLEIDASAREVVTEIGNILLNACLGTFGNLLKVQVSFSVPAPDPRHARRRGRLDRGGPPGAALRADRPRRRSGFATAA